MPLTIGSGWTLGPGWVGGGDAGPAPVVSTDPYFMYNSLLLTGDGTNLSQNNTFLDSSTNNFAITRAGNTTQGTFTPYGDNWSVSFNGAQTSPSLTYPSISAYDLGSTSQWTYECWVYFQSVSGEQSIFERWSGTGGPGWLLTKLSNNAYRAHFGSSIVADTGAIAVAGQWIHLAVSRNGSTGSIFVNGTRQATTGSVANFSDGTDPLVFGERNSGGQTFPLNGYISNARIVKGTYVYDPSATTITVPTSPLTAVTNTVFLGLQSNRFVDNSSNNATATVGSASSIQRFSPFEPSAAYSTSTTGGSGYFDGSGDFLTAPANTAFNLGTGDFTIECWVYLTNSTATTQSIMGIGDTGTINDIQLWYNNVTNKITFNVYGNPRFDSSSTVTTGNWIHLACTRASGTFKLFINGAQESTGSLGNNLSNNVLVIGRPYASLPNNEYFYGYISNLRIVKGTAVYTSAFTPPTTPVTAISGTSVLTNFTNAGIIDNAMINDLETVGNAKISTTQSKFGSSSMSFDGTGDWLTTLTNPNLVLGSSDFTVECWVYTGTTGSRSGIIGNRTGAGGDAVWCIDLNPTNVAGWGYIYFHTDNTQIVYSSTNYSANTWFHLAVTRSGTTFRMFLGGTQVGSATSSINLSSTATMYIGAEGARADQSSPLNGYIDDLRVTKGYARYTANFTPPTAALPTY